MRAIAHYRRIIMKRFSIKIAGMFFGVSLSFFGLMNLISALPEGWPSRSGGITSHARETYGFPFVMHEYGGYFTIDQFIWSGVVANLSVAVVSSLIIGLLAGYVWKGIFSRNRSLQ